MLVLRDPLWCSVDGSCDQAFGEAGELRYPDGDEPQRAAPTEGELGRQRCLLQSPSHERQAIHGEVEGRDGKGRRVDASGARYTEPAKHGARVKIMV